MTNGDKIRRDDWQKITQLVILPIVTPEFEVVEEMPETERGADGFGRTGL